MIKFYFASSLVWWLIIYASITLTISQIIENGWVEDIPDQPVLKTMNRSWFSLFMALVPVVRVLVALGLWLLFIEKKNKEDV